MRASARPCATVAGEFAHHIGDTYEEALADVKSAIQFHIETFGSDVMPDDSPVFEPFIAEGTIAA